MATLSVWKFDSADGAGAAKEMLTRLHEHQQIQLQDAAIISWPQDARKPSITVLHSLVGGGALGGAFWGSVFALVFLVPPLGMAIAAGVGELIASSPDIGIDERWIKSLRDKLPRETSALLLLTTSAVTDRVLDEMQAQSGHAHLIEANLTREQESKLRRVFAV
jgi:uncharacterized membrane protein